MTKISEDDRALINVLVRLGRSLPDRCQTAP